MSTTGPRNSDKHNIANCYYEAARQEILERLRLRDQFLLTYVMASATLFGLVIGQRIEDLRLLLVVPYVALGFSVLVSQHHAVIGSLLFFCGNELAPSLIADMSASVPKWESSRTYRIDFARALMRRLWAHFLLLLLPPTVSLWLTRACLKECSISTIIAWYCGLVFTICAASLIRLGFSFRRRAFNRTQKPPLDGPFPAIISHRGKTGESHTENTIESFKAAATLGIDMIELDVHQTMDGRLVIHHDDSPKPEAEPWCKLDLAVAQKLHQEHTGSKVPTLEECVSVVGAVPLNIEIKSLNDSDIFSRIIRESAPPPGSILSCKHLNTLECLSGKISLPLFLVLRISKNRTIRENLRNLRILFLPYTLPRILTGVAADYRYLYGMFIRILQKRNQLVLAWVVDQPAMILRLTHIGVNGIITSRPELVAALLGRAVLGQEKYDQPI
jgi:glycerophosphoryl diester phosphodiesterase